MVWRKHKSGVCSKYIWAPELHRVNGAWYILFRRRGTRVRAERHAHPPHVRAENTDADPTTDNWVEKGQIVTPMDSLSLDATTEVIDGVQYLVWAQKDYDIPGNSNLYIVRWRTRGRWPLIR